MPTIGSQRQRTWVNDTLESKKERKSLRMRGDARINENLTAVTDERPLPRGSLTEGLHLLISVVDYLRGGSPAKPSSVRLNFLSCPDSFLLCLFFSCLSLAVSFYGFSFFAASIFLSLIFSAYVCHVTTAGSLC